MTIIENIVLNLTVTIEADTQRIARDIASLVQVGDIIALSGDLGTGKTVFSRAFIHALGGRGEVPSPTFTMVQSYDLGSLIVHHLDLYRMEQPEDAFELGIEELFTTGVTLVEWPARLGVYLPNDRLNLMISHPRRLSNANTVRTITLEGVGSWQSRMKELSWKLDDA